MKCYEHPDVDAVVQCPNCSKGLCRTCADIFEQPICMSCAQQIANQELANARMFLGEIKGQRIRSILSIAWAAAMMALGFYAAFSHPNYQDWLFHLIVFFGFGGLPWLISKSMNHVETTSSQLQKIRSDMLVLSLGSGAASGMIIGKALVLIVIFLFSAVLTPLRVIMTIINLKRLKKTRAEVEEFIASYA